MKIRLASSVQLESYADGKGIRMVIWNQGCLMHCPGCHNPETHDTNGGQEYEIDDIKKIIFNNKNTHQGITLSGGDPFLQVDANMELANYAHSLGLDVWAYCGLTFEKISLDNEKKKLLEQCDILVDGAFVLKLKDKRLAFRGSSNQRIIDVQKSLQKGEVIEINL